MLSAIFAESNQPSPSSPIPIIFPHGLDPILEHKVGTADANLTGALDMIEN